MTNNQIMFFIFSAIIVIFSILTVTQPPDSTGRDIPLVRARFHSGTLFYAAFQFPGCHPANTLMPAVFVVLIIFSILLTSQVGANWKCRASQKRSLHSLQQQQAPHYVF